MVREASASVVADSFGARYAVAAICANSASNCGFSSSRNAPGESTSAAAAAAALSSAAVFSAAHSAAAASSSSGEAISAAPSAAAAAASSGGETNPAGRIERAAC